MVIKTFDVVDTFDIGYGIMGGGRRLSWSPAS